MRIGILGLQGAVGPHRQKLQALDVEPVVVRTAAELEACAGLILPGGESTTMLNLIDHYGLGQALLAFAATRPVWGVCAGSILMAQTVENPPQRSFALMPITVRRNAYGRQNESFVTQITLTLPDAPAQTQEAVFIRAPKIMVHDPAVTVLAEHDGAPVAVHHGRHLCTTFHPELSSPTTLHAFFLKLCAQQHAAPAAASAR